MSVPVTTAMQNSIANLYIAILGRNPEPAGFAYWVDAYANANATQSSLNSIAMAFGKSPEFIGTYGGRPTQDAVALMYQNVLNRTADTAGLAYWTNYANNLINGSVPYTVGEALALTGNALITAAAANTGTADATLIAGKQTNAVAAGTTAPATPYTLTTNTDIASATNFYGTVNAATGNTFTAGDQLTGTGASASLTLADAGNAGLTTALITPGGATLSNVKTLTINGNNVAASTISTAGSLFSGINTVNVTEGGQVALTLGSSQAGNLNLTATAALNSSVNGGAAVTVTSAGATTGTLNVGQTTAGTGAASVTVTGTAYAAATTDTLGVINVASGTSASVTANAFANTTAAATDGAAGTRTLGAVAVDGTSTTTSASVTQTNASTATNYSAGTATAYVVNGVAGVTNGAVTIRDATAIAGTAAANAGTLATVTLSGYGVSTISSNALATLNLAGTGGTLGITTGLTTPTNRTLALNLNAITNQGQAGANVNGGDNTITDSTAPAGLGYTTINITNTGSSRLSGIAAVDTTALSLAGSGTLTMTAVNGMSTLQTVTVTGSAGLSSTGTFATTVTSINASGTSGNMTINLTGLETATAFTGYQGGSGVDTVTVATAPTKAISGGSGSADVIVNNANTDIVVGNANITGFEILRAGTAATGTLSANGFTGLQLGAVAGNITFNNVAAGTALTFLASPGNNTTYTLANSAGTSDAVTINLNTGTSSNNALIAAGTVTTTGVETINIVMTDTPTSATTGVQAGRNAALVNTMTLADATATTINVSGNAGLTLTNTALDKVTTFNASAVVAGTALAAGAVIYTSATTKANSATTTITGGAGADVLTGGATADTISGGSGNDTIDGGLGADIIDGGAGSGDRFVSVANGATEGAGLGTINGMVINLGSTAVAATTIATALNTGAGALIGVSGAITSVAAGTAVYTYTTPTALFSSVTDTLTGIERVTGSAGSDYIVGSNGVANSITAGNGADRIDITETTPTSDTLVLANTSSVAATVDPADANFAANQTLTYGNGVDVIVGFAAGVGGDVLDLDAATAAVTGIGVANNAMTAGTNYFLSGSFVVATGVFTIAANGAGADTLIIQAYAGAGVDIATNAGVVVLVGVNSANLVAGNIS